MSSMATRLSAIALFATSHLPAVLIAFLIPWTPSASVNQLACIATGVAPFFALRIWAPFFLAGAVPNPFGIIRGYAIWMNVAVFVGMIAMKIFVSVLHAAVPGGIAMGEDIFFILTPVVIVELCQYILKFQYILRPGE